MSPYGNLTISFNKPIILPPVRVDPLKSRLLDDDEKLEYDIKEVIGFKVNSEFYDERSDETNIEDYYLTRLEEHSLDI